MLVVEASSLRNPNFALKSTEILARQSRIERERERERENRITSAVQPCEFSCLQFWSGPQSSECEFPSANCGQKGGTSCFCCVQLCTHRGLLNGHRAQGTRREAEAPRGQLGACSGCRQCRGFLRCRNGASADLRIRCAQPRAEGAHPSCPSASKREREREGERENIGGLQGRGASDTSHVPGKKRESEGHNSPP